MSDHKLEYISIYTQVTLISTQKKNMGTRNL